MEAPAKCCWHYKLDRPWSRRASPSTRSGGQSLPLRVGTPLGVTQPWWHSTAWWELRPNWNWFRMTAASWNNRSWRNKTKQRDKQGGKCLWCLILHHHRCHQSHLKGVSGQSDRQCLVVADDNFRCRGGDGLGEWPTEGDVNLIVSHRSRAQHQSVGHILLVSGMDSGNKQKNTAQQNLSQHVTGPWTFPHWNDVFKK